MQLVLFKYNNYYNRIVKRQDSLQGYLDDGATGYWSTSNVNFNPNDGISTSQVVNFDFSTAVPDYCICLENDTTITSRWFVLEAKRIRNGQYELSLLRDLIADNYNEIINAPMFIEKASLSSGDPRIFNSENMTYNKIKTSETLLKDATSTPWIVGYIARNTPATTVAVPAEEIEIDYELSSLEGYTYYSYSYDNPYKMSYADFTVKMYLQDTFDGAQTAWDRWGYSKAPALEVKGEKVQGFPVGGTYSTHKSGYWRKFLTNWYEPMSDALNYTTGRDWFGESYAYTGVSPSPMDLAGENGKIIKAGTKYYRIKYNTRITDVALATVNKSTSYGYLINEVASKMSKIDYSNTNNLDPVGAIEYKANAAYFTYEQLSVNSYTFPITTDRTKATDSPYDIFAIPYSDVSLHIAANLRLEVGDISSRLAQAIINALGVGASAQLYDIQLLPYCPVRTFGSTVDISKMVENKDYRYIKDANGSVGTIVFWLKESSFTVEIKTGIINTPSDPVEFKVANECDKYRIVSPTYNGEFEFSATANNGVSGYVAYCTYKPFSPFIKIAPIFGGLYGEEFGDARGCICQGDFSLPQVNDAWVNYQVQNKNYINSFNRQIQNMEVNNAYQREMEKYSVMAGAMQAAGTGAMTGSMAGGVYGAVAGAIGAGTVSALAGAKDIELAEGLRREALDFTKDQFGYSLGNIAALPYSLANIGAQTVISKLFPILEYYTCTEVEKQALRDKIRYNGMTVGTIGAITSFLQSTPTYIKGKLIRLETVGEEFHYVNAIANELNKGVFI